MNRPRIIVSGALANKHGQGGEAWVRLSWILGLQRLGFDVLFLEELGGTPDPAVVRYFQQTVERFGLADTSALISLDGESLAGLSRAAMIKFASESEALINISGHLTLEPVMERVRPRVYIDIDPGFTQFWHASELTGARLNGHDYYFTIGRNIGLASCEIPTRGVVWRHTFPPVVLEEWPVIDALGRDAVHCAPEEGKVSGKAGDGVESAPTHLRAAPAEAKFRFTTIANWRGSFGPVQFGGKTYGLKVHEFRKFIELPRRSGRSFEIALQIHPGDNRDLDALRACGWRIVDPAQLAATPDGFRQYVQASGAEFSVAQGMYVDTNSGWFSDRTVRYLASGKPALVQETGFSRHIPVGKGLLSFRTMDEAIEGAARIAREYQEHCRAARQLAEEYFDSDKVIGQMLAEIGLASQPASQ
jgi:hypothetical protein